MSSPIYVIGLKNDDNLAVKKILEHVPGSERCKIQAITLRKSDLRGFSFSTGSMSAAAAGRPAAVVLVARNEGRVLLTDRNGFYEEVLEAACRQARGRIAVVLTRCPVQDERSLCDSHFINNLAEGGGQPKARALERARRLFTWDDGPNRVQNEALSDILQLAMSDQESSIEGLPESWMEPPADEGMFGFLQCGIL